jgi:hypothetical protein
VEDSIDLISPQTFDDISPTRYIAMEECEVRSRFQHARVVPRATVVQLVEGDDSIMVGILGHQMPNKPGCTASLSLTTILQGMALT